MPIKAENAELVAAMKTLGADALSHPNGCACTINNLMEPTDPFFAEKWRAESYCGGCDWFECVLVKRAKPFIASEYYSVKV